jgi:NTE family protein
MNDFSSTPLPKILPPRGRLPVGRPDRCDCVALVLQGGGALGAYQAGVYQAMHEANILPDWVSGVSIGAINAALLPETRHTGAWRSFTPFGI